MQKLLMQEIFMILKANWIIVDLETGQHEYSYFPVYYNYIKIKVNTQKSKGRSEWMYKIT